MANYRSAVGGEPFDSAFKDELGKSNDYVNV